MFELGIKTTIINYLGCTTEYLSCYNMQGSRLEAKSYKGGVTPAILNILYSSTSAKQLMTPIIHLRACLVRCWPQPGLHAATRPDVARLVTCGRVRLVLVPMHAGPLHPLFGSCRSSVEN